MSSEEKRAAAPELRWYQARDVERIRAAFGGGHRRILYAAPTGSGKTVLFVYIVERAVARGNRVCIVAHRLEIVEQISAALTALGVPHGIIMAGRPMTDAPVQVASVMTLVRRLEAGFAPDLIVPDEAHHVVAGSWLKIIWAAPGARVLGVTATPERLDGKGLGDVFEHLVVGPSISELTPEFLAPFLAYVPEDPPDLRGVRTLGGDYRPDELAETMGRTVVIQSAVDEYKQLVDGAPAIVFCVDIRHSRMVAERFREAGYRAEHVDGETPSDRRRALIAALGSGELQVLTNCGLISEGVDVPVVKAAILLRPTKSLALYLQQVGRALRPAPGKERALILDHAGNVMAHGMPDDPRGWSLKGREKKNGKAAPSYKRCPDCGAVNSMAARSCGGCGHEFRAIVVPYQEIESKLIPGKRLPMTAERIARMSYHAAIGWAGGDERKLHQVAQARGYKAGWVFYRMQEFAEQQSD
jgi:superfamily II DNA or RNA helicase